MRLRLVFFLICTLMLFSGCKKSYDPLQPLTDHVKSFLPFVPGDTLIFLNSKNEKKVFVSDVSQKTQYFDHAFDIICEMCEGRYPEVRELYKSNLTKKSFDGNIIWFEADINWDFNTITGEEFEILTLRINVNDQKSHFELIADDYDHWDHINDSYFKNDFPSISFSVIDTFIKINRTFYNVFTSQQKAPRFYYSQTDGLIGFEIDTTFWINEKLK